MRVLVAIFEELVPLSGGGTPRTLNVIKAFIRRGYEVCVACSIGVTKEEALRELGCSDLLPLIGVSRLDTKKTTKYIYAHPLNILRVVKYATRIKPDLIICHNSIAGFSALLGKKLKGECLVILDLTDLLFEYLEEYRDILWMKPVQVMGRKMEKATIKNSDKIITISGTMRDILLGYRASPENIEVVCDGVDTEVFRHTDETQLRRKLAKGAKHVVILQGVIDLQDNPGITVNAAEQVIGKYPKTMFWIVGDGMAVPELRKRVLAGGLSRNFYFSGWVRQEEVSAYISASDIGLVILPDVLSARGRVTLKEFEYWACGIPAVVPRLPALEEVVEEGKTGLFYDPGNAADLAEKIGILIEDEEMRRKMGENGKKMVKEKFQWDRLADRFVEICDGYLVGRKE